VAKQEGIDLGATAETIDILHPCYSGMELHDDGLHLHPVLSPKLGSSGFSIRYRGHSVHLEFTSETARVGVDLGEGEPINVDISASPGPDRMIDVPLGADAARGRGSG
jgi:trehalose/maltose hydrolase-like predicted phosphorylase